MRRRSAGFYILALAAAITLSACDGDTTIVSVAPSALHPEGCGKHAPAIASRPIKYERKDKLATLGGFLSVDGIYSGTLVTCRDGVVVLVP